MIDHYDNHVFEFVFIDEIFSFAHFQMVEICKKLDVGECDVICTFLSKNFGSNLNWRQRQIFSEFCYQWVSEKQTKKIVPFSNLK